MTAQLFSSLGLYLSPPCLMSRAILRSRPQMLYLFLYLIFLKEHCDISFESLVHCAEVRLLTGMCEDRLCLSGLFHRSEGHVK